MKNRDGRRASIPLLALVALALLACVAPAGTEDVITAGAAADHDLSWWTVDGGGTMGRQGAAYTLGGTLGQPDAGSWYGGSYTLDGGFWAPWTAHDCALYLPLIIRSG